MSKSCKGIYAVAGIFLMVSATGVLAGALPDPVERSDGLTPTGVEIPPQPLRLESAIAFALDHNPDMAVAAERIAQARAKAEEALAVFYPEFKARVGYHHSTDPAEAFSMILSQRRFSFEQNINRPGGTQNFRPEIIGSLSLYRGGQDYHRRKAAEIAVQISELDQASARNNLVESVTALYFGYLAAEAEQVVANYAVRTVRSELEQTRVRYEQGTVLKSDLLSLQVRLAEAEDTALKAANAVELMRTGLKNLLGVTVQAELAIASVSQIQLPARPGAFDSILQSGLAQRPEMQAAVRRVAIQERELKIQQGAHLPKVDAYVRYGQDARNLTFSTQRDNVSAGVSLEMPLFEGFRTSARVDAAERGLLEAKAARQAVRLAIEKELKSAFLSLEEALARVRVTETALVAAQEALRLVKAQRDAGSATITRYLQAELDREAAQSRAIAARFDALKAQAALNRAMGIGQWRKPLDG